MAKTIRFAVVLFLGSALVGRLSAEQARGPATMEELRKHTVVSWSAPLYWSPGSGVTEASPSTREKSTTSLPTAPLPFVGIPPCRLADTRDASYPPGFGPPSLVGGAARTFTLPGRCGLPSEAAAYSLNLTVIPPANPPFSFLSVFPTGGSPPAVSTLNWGTGGTSNVYFNAAVVPAGTSGGIDVFVSSGTDLIIDVNGYYANDLTSQNGQFTFTSDINGGAGGAGVLLVHNSDSAGANSWAGHFWSDSCNAGSAGLFGEGTSAGCAPGVYGVWGRSFGTTNGSTGVYGEEVGGGSTGTGFNFGVKGLTTSTAYDAAGVKGVGGFGDPLGDDTDCATCLNAGVRGMNSTFGHGVLGISFEYGTTGIVLTGNPPVQAAFGILGFFDGISTYYGVLSSSGAHLGPVFFIEPHPQDASKTITYTALEGPEAGTYFRGTAQTQGGQAVISVPESFRLVTEAEGITIQLTAIGDLANLAVISQDLNRIVVKSSKDVRFHYQVNGVRHGYGDFNPVSTSGVFAPQKPDGRVPAYLNEAQKRSLVSNGTYNADGSVNLETAHAQGWDKAWQAPPQR